MRHPPLNARFFVASDGTTLVRQKKYISYKVRRAVFDRDGSRCRSCGREVVFFTQRFWIRPDDYRPVGHVDHIIPIARGGQTEMSNLRLLCEYCNLSKCAD